MARLVAISWLIDTLKFTAGRVDLLVLGAFRSPFAVANYQAALNFLDVAQRVAQPITMVAFADLAKMGAAGQGRELLRVVGKLSLLALFVMTPVCTALLVVAPWLCHLVYGVEYPDAALLLQILAFSLLWLTGLWMQSSFISVGKPGWGLEVVVIMTTVKVGLLFALTPSYGGVGVAIANLAYCLSMPLLIPMYLARLRRWIASPEYEQRVTPPAVEAPVVQATG